MPRPQNWELGTSLGVEISDQHPYTFYEGIPWWKGGGGGGGMCFI